MGEGDRKGSDQAAVRAARRLRESAYCRYHRDRRRRTR
jgi:hypothetical protein